MPTERQLAEQARAEARAQFEAERTNVKPHEVWVYDFMDGKTPVRDWATTNKSEAFTPGTFNQRRYVAAPAAPAPDLQSIEQYRLQMAGISSAALGYWTEEDGIHPDYDTVPLRDVAKLYAKYATLYKAAAPAHVPEADFGNIKPLTDAELDALIPEQLAGGSKAAPVWSQRQVRQAMRAAIAASKETK